MSIILEEYDEFTLRLSSKKYSNIQLQLIFLLFQPKLIEHKSGVFISSDHYEIIDSLVHKHNTYTLFEEQEAMTKRRRRSRQKEFHREKSDDEYSSSENEDDNNTEIFDKNCKRKPVKLTKNLDSTLLVYNSEDSDSEDDDSDSSGFPDPTSPRDHKKEYKVLRSRFEKNLNI